MSRGSSSSEESDSSGDTFAPDMMLEALKSEGRIYRIEKTKLWTIRIKPELNGQFWISINECARYVQVLGIFDSGIAFTASVPICGEQNLGCTLTSFFARPECGKLFRTAQILFAFLREYLLHWLINSGYMMLYDAVLLPTQDTPF